MFYISGCIFMQFFKKEKKVKYNRIRNIQIPCGWTTITDEDEIREELNQFLFDIQIN